MPAHLFRYRATGSADLSLRSFKKPEKLKAGSLKPESVVVAPGKVTAAPSLDPAEPPLVCRDGLCAAASCLAAVVCTGVDCARGDGCSAGRARSCPCVDPGMGVANGSNSDMSGPGRVVGVADVDGVAVGRSLAGSA